MAAWAKLVGDLRLSLISHSCDVAATLEAILRCSPMLRRRLATAGNLDDLNDIQIARLIVLTFLHDFGKCNRGFQNKEFRKTKPTPFIAGHIREALVLLYDEPCIERFVQLVWD